MSHLIINQLNLPKLLEKVATLPSLGKLKISTAGLVYLDIDDRYIHELLPLLNDKNAKKPAYFNATFSNGAHISVIYPEEKVLLSRNDLESEHRFNILGTFSAEKETRRYYVLMVQSDSLLELRQHYGLSNKLLLGEIRLICI